MNTLSWFIYFANVLPNIGNSITVLGVFALCLCFMAAFFYALHEERRPPQINKWIIGFTVVIIISSFIPSKGTIYAIAVSEMGEKAYKSEIGVKGIKALEAWIDKQITPSTK